MKLDEKWFFYALGAGAASVGESAHAGIIYSNPEPDPSGTSIYFDLQTPTTSPSSFGAADFQISGDVKKAKANTSILGQSATSGTADGTAGNGTGFALRLGLGAPIDGSLNFTPTATLGDFFAPAGPPNYGNLGNWNPGDSGFLGLTIQIAGQTHYGWARGTLDSVFTFTLNDYAYETDADMAIAAGAVPEPDQTLLALLVAGAGGIGLMRRRNRASGIPVEQAVRDAAE